MLCCSRVEVQGLVGVSCPMSAKMADKADRTFSDCVDMLGMAVISGELRVEITHALGPVVIRLPLRQGKRVRDNKRDSGYRKRFGHSDLKFLRSLLLCQDQK